MDRYLIDERGIDGYQLMQKAARAAFRQLLRSWPQCQRVVVLCGAGNNGGDGYLVALNALRQGLDALVVAVISPEKLTGDARRAWLDAQAGGVSVSQWGELDADGTAALVRGAGVIVDAMLGTGARGRPRAPVDEVIALVNRSGNPVLAVDVPSGLNASLGTVEGDAVEASVTVTFIGQKLGLVTGRGPHYTGEVVYESLGAEASIDGCPVEPLASQTSWFRQSTHLPRLSRAAHKGDLGHVLVVAGDLGFGGAGLLAAEAASRSGAGLVTLATRPEHVAPALARCPSIMVRGLIHGNELARLMEKADVIVCGPGIGQSAWGEQMLQQVLACDKPRLLDADALNLLADRVPVKSEAQIITPHPGEASRLLGCSVADIEADRLSAVSRLQTLFGGIVLLKGAGTLIASAGRLPALVAGANPGLATGGMGDVLSGISGALLAQRVRQGGGDLCEPVITAAALHLEAANRASRQTGYRSLLPLDVIDALSSPLREAEAVNTGVDHD